MKSTLRFDPRLYNYGPATEAIQQILLDWESIDWFTPAATHADEAKELFRKHNELGYAFAPTLFSRSVDVSHRAGGWSEFMAWCTRVRSPPLSSVPGDRSVSWEESWDWKYSVLKPLSMMQAKAHGWSLDQENMHDGEPRPGDLFVRYRRVDSHGVEHSFVSWCGLGEPIAELELRWREPAGKAAIFYHMYAGADVIDCIEWQLAKRSNSIADNPFVPLLACYRAGFYPFSLSRDSVVLFEFTTAELPEHDSE